MTTKPAIPVRHPSHSIAAGPHVDAIVRHLYLHIPFCPSKCSYCAFVTHVGSLKLLDPYLHAVQQELAQISALPGSTVLDTIYFGGGTPSVMTPEQLVTVLNYLQQHFEIGTDLECTLEAHPATVNAEKLRGYRSAGVTRISFGAETLNRAELASVGRTYTVDQVLDLVRLSRAAGFADVALDLMYGLPGQTVASWRRTLQVALHAGVDHFSLYPLAVEPFTVFARRQRAGSLSLPPDETVVEMYRVSCALLREHGYEHYEVSNWARPGHRCRHNMAYWLNRQFHAVGVGAHGYVKPYRYQHVRQTKRYIDALAAGTSAITQREAVTLDMERAETIMLRLRLLQDGLNLVELRECFGIDLAAAHAEEIHALVAGGFLTYVSNTLRLTETAVPVANDIWQRFM